MGAWRGFGVIACLLFVALPALAQPVLPDAPRSGGGEASTQQLFPITPAVMEAYLKAREIAFTTGKSNLNLPYFKATVNDLNNMGIYFFFTNCSADQCQYLEIKAFGPAAKSVDLSFVNKWNRQWVPTKLYLDSDGSWAFLHPVYVGRGLTVEQLDYNIAEFLKMLHKLFGK